MKTKNLIPAIALLGSLSYSCTSANEHNLNAVNSYVTTSTVVLPPDSSSKIQVALLFDTSNSMDGLIDQAKSRLWDIVNTLTTLKYQDKTPQIEIALYEYGNDGLEDKTSFIRQVAPLTTDLDLISEKLFSLKTNGGSEYCGAVIAKSVKDLKWDDGNNTMKLVYIAGNEGFNQGSINYKEAISDAQRNNIYINTIFCGPKQDGIRLFWKDGAIAGQGKFFNIDSDKQIQYVQTPYDDQINACNERLNKTYISYGSKGYSKKQNQIAQDANAQSVSKSNATERVVSKSKSVYKNTDWDLVDSYKENETNIDKIKQEELPEEYKNKSKEEIKKIVTEKSKEREKIQKEIGELAVKRQQYIKEASKQSNTQDDLGTAIKSSIISFAGTKGYSVEN